MRARAAMLDEALIVLTGLWSGESFSHQGTYYTVRGAQFLPPALQSPRIPIWVGGTWPLRGPIRRAARWDGVFPHFRDGSGRIVPMPPPVLREMLAFIREHRDSEASFAVVLRGASPDDRSAAAAMVEPYREAGLTWWLEGVDGGRDLAAIQARIRRGPPDVQGEAPVL